MTNFEKYGNKIMGIDFALDKRTRKLCGCHNIECEKCLFDDLTEYNCSLSKWDWLKQEASQLEDLRHNMIEEITTGETVFNEPSYCYFADLYDNVCDNCSIDKYVKEFNKTYNKNYKCLEFFHRILSLGVDELESIIKK